ncbi:hypothetical protein BKA93DRAFT_753426, partial [Sparassis latifolia]
LASTTYPGDRPIQRAPHLRRLNTQHTSSLVSLGPITLTSGHHPSSLHPSLLRRISYRIRRSAFTAQDGLALNGIQSTAKLELSAHILIFTNCPVLTSLRVAPPRLQLIFAVRRGHVGAGPSSTFSWPRHLLCEPQGAFEMTFADSGVFFVWVPDSVFAARTSTSRARTAGPPARRVQHNRLALASNNHTSMQSSAKLEDRPPLHRRRFHRVVHTAPGGGHDCWATILPMDASRSLCRSSHIRTKSQRRGCGRVSGVVTRVTGPGPATSAHGLGGRAAGMGRTNISEGSRQCRLGVDFSGKNEGVRRRQIHGGARGEGRRGQEWTAMRETRVVAAAGESDMGGRGVDVVANAGVEDGGARRRVPWVMGNKSDKGDESRIAAGGRAMTSLERASGVSV